jgi:hypothetical protein
MRSKQVVHNVFPRYEIGSVYYDTLEDGQDDEGIPHLFRATLDASHFLVSIQRVPGDQEDNWGVELDSLFPTRYTALLVQGEESSSAGLVLRQQSSGSDSVFERVGYFDLGCKLEWLHTWQTQTLKLI